MINITRTALIDGDEIAYKLAFKYQDTFYNIIDKDGKILNRYSTKEEAVEEVGDLLDSDEYTIEKCVERRDISTLKTDLDFLLDKIVASAFCTDYIITLSGYFNFRYKLATILPYKGDRSKDDKPVWLEVIKDFMRDHYRHGQKDFLEADDYMSATYSSNPDKQMVICSTDKDLRTVPSWNYNIMKGEYQEIDKYKARFNFYIQLLIGDSTDNIPSPYGLGPESAKKIIEPIYGLADPQDLDYYQAIVPEYIKYLNMKSKDGTYKTKWHNPSQNVHQILWEVGNLLWMRRTFNEDERWQLPL